MFFSCSELTALSSRPVADSVNNGDMKNWAKLCRDSQLFYKSLVLLVRALTARLEVRMPNNSLMSGMIWSVSGLASIFIYSLNEFILYINVIIGI